MIVSPFYHTFSFNVCSVARVTVNQHEQNKNDHFHSMKQIQCEMTINLVGVESVEQQTQSSERKNNQMINHLTVESRKMR